MDGQTIFYALLALLVAGASVFLAVMLRKGKMTKTQVGHCLELIISLCRSAEDMWAGQEKAGKQKKAWVLEQLQSALDGMNVPTLSNLIDGIVALLNDLGWPN